MAEQKTNVMRLLEQHKISYRAHEYPHGKDAVDGKTVAALLGEDPGQVFKTLVTHGSGRNYYEFVLPVEAALSLKKAARAVGEKAIEMIHVKEITPLTGYVRGGCSPLGMKKAFPTVFDESVLTLPSVIVSAGKIGFQIETAPDDLLRLTGAKTADLVL